jgi:hypothetical protein
MGVACVWLVRVRWPCDQIVVTWPIDGSFSHQDLREPGSRHDQLMAYPSESGDAGGSNRGFSRVLQDSSNILTARLTCEF